MPNHVLVWDLETVPTFPVLLTPIVTTAGGMTRSASPWATFQGTFITRSSALAL